MPLPPSFLRDGYTQTAPRGKFKRLMVGTDGLSETGKTEFGMSAPGPGIVLCIDRGYEACLDNQEPPVARRDDFAFKVIQIPLASQSNSPKFYADYWQEFYKEYLKALANPDARTIVLDGDSDSWELQRLAAFGKLTQIPPLMYTECNAARRVMIARAYDSGKIIIATNKVKGEYVDEVDKLGNPVLGNDGKPKRVRSGELERQGFSDTDYLWQVQLRHMYKPAGINSITKKETPQQWGVKIMKCKTNASLVGSELWGSDCNFESLVQTIYPHIDVKEWGF